MRLRWQRRIRKQLRRMRGPDLALANAVAKLERSGIPLYNSLREIMLDPARFQHERALSGSLLSVAESQEAVRALLRLFFEQTEKNDLYTTALTIESMNDRCAVPPLVRALLYDENPHRRHAAARALGWIQRPGRAAALALAQCLMDVAQPRPAREEAAESLAYVGSRETIGSLISVFRDADVRIRFWAVFGLGRSCRGDARAIQALESLLDDPETPRGNWWPVGKEALAMLAQQPELGNYKIKLSTEVHRILADANATAEERRWAGFYG